jgi:hypothetical protein
MVTKSFEIYLIGGMSDQQEAVKSVYKWTQSKIRNHKTTKQITISFVATNKWESVQDLPEPCWYGGATIMGPAIWYCAGDFKQNCYALEVKKSCEN